MFNIVTQVINNVPFTVVSLQRCDSSSKVVVLTRKELATKVVTAVMKYIPACMYYVYYRPVTESVINVIADISRTVVAGVHCVTVSDLIERGFTVYVYRVSEEGDMEEIRLIQRVQYKTIWSRRKTL